MSALRFVVPMPPNVTNPTSHMSRNWRAQHRLKVEFTDRLDLTRVALGRLKLADGRVIEIPPAPALPFARVSMRSVMYLGGAMDDDNALARHKPLIDWLKTRGYLADDRKKNIVWEGLPEQVVKRDGNYRIELTITPLAAS